MNIKSTLSIFSIVLFFNVLLFAQTENQYSKFDPVSLKENDKYERAIDGYLPTADVVFLDEADCLERHVFRISWAYAHTVCDSLHSKILQYT